MVAQFRDPELRHHELHAHRRCEFLCLIAIQRLSGLGRQIEMKNAEKEWPRPSMAMHLPSMARFDSWIDSTDWDAGPFCALFATKVDHFVIRVVFGRPLAHIS
jgi:hypothetical protein